MSFGIWRREQGTHVNEEGDHALINNIKCIELACPTKSLTKSASSSMKLSLLSPGRSPATEEVRTSFITRSFS